MIIIEDEAEKKALEELAHIRSEAGFRFIHYSFSKLGEQERGVAQEVITTKIIAEILDKPYAKAFVCQDSDVIIIGADIFSKTYSRLTLEIGKHLESENLQVYSKIYDVSDSWAYLHKLVQDKCDSINTKAQLQLEKMRKEKAADEVKQILSGDNLDKSLIASVFERRERRKEVNILIVEDDAFSRKLIRNVLNKAHNVIDVEDGKDAISSYVTISPDVVFLDINLPDVNGHEILHAILKFDPKAYIIMLSGNADQQNIMKAMSAGAKGFVAKPFLKDRLYKYINDCPTVAAKTMKAKTGV